MNEKGITIRRIVLHYFLIFKILFKFKFKSVDLLQCEPYRKYTHPDQSTLQCRFQLNRSLSILGIYGTQEPWTSNQNK